LQQLGPGSLTAHAAEEIGVVVTTASKRVYRRHHLGSAIWVMVVEPRPEQRRHLVRQAHRKMETAGRAGLHRGLYDVFQFMVRDLRNNGGDCDVTRNPLVVERLDGRKPLSRLWGARLESSGDLRIQ